MYSLLQRKILYLRLHLETVLVFWILLFLAFGLLKKKQPLLFAMSIRKNSEITPAPRLNERQGLAYLLGPYGERGWGLDFLVW